MDGQDKLFILDMNHEQAREFFLKPNSYFSLNLPNYFNLNYLLSEAIKLLNTKQLETKTHLGDVKNYSKFADINYIIQVNKTTDSYRPMTLIHPLLYVDYINFLTNKENWEKLIERFHELRNNVKNKITCSSIPFDTKADHTSSNFALHYWKEIEQESIKLSLKYNRILKVDISNFYGNIYTHTIAWAMEGEDTAKESRRETNLIGNMLDRKFQRMNYGETVGIPQGNVISDFIAELLLAHLDKLLVEKLENIDYQVLRYRDDYRIFTNSKEDESTVKKELIVLLQRYKLSLGTAKTLSSSDIINNSIKPDKHYWIEHDPVIKTTVDKIYTLPKKYFNEEEFHKIFHNRIYKVSIQKHLFIIKYLSDHFPNSGQLTKALVEFEERINELNYSDFEHNGTNIEVLISILLDIINKNPKITVVGIKLLSVLLNKIQYQDFEHFFSMKGFERIPKSDFEMKLDLISETNKKLMKKTNNAYFEIWGQRLVVQFINKENKFSKNYIETTKEPLVKLCNDIVVKNTTCISLFNEEWLKEEYRIDLDKFIDKEEIQKLPNILTKEEIKLAEYW